MAISSGWPTRPSGTREMKPSCISLGMVANRSVAMGPGLRTLVRILRSFRSFVQVRAKERTAALLAL